MSTPGYFHGFSSKPSMSKSNMDLKIILRIDNHSSGVRTNHIAQLDNAW
jgi:hypothetical protein